MLELTNIWKDRPAPNKLKVKPMKILVWTVMMYGAEGWTLRKSDEQKIRGAEMWFYRRLLCVNWTQTTTNKSILEELGEKRQLLELVIRRKHILWQCILTSGKWTNQIDVPRKRTGKKR